MPLVPQRLSTFNLSETSLLLLEPVASEADLYAGMLAGFGAKHINRCVTAEEAEAALKREQVDLLVIDAKLGSADGYEFVRQMRFSKDPRQKFVPVLMIAGHTPRSKVTLARDAGSHFVVRKPVSAAILLERILWIAQENRAFVECPVYIGPERRFKSEGPPGGEPRRHDDLSAEIGDAEGPNLDQDQVDQLMQPRKHAA